MDRATLVIAVAFVGGAALLVGLFWLLVRLDRAGAPQPAVVVAAAAPDPAPIGYYEPVVAGAVVVREPEPEPEIQMEPEPEPEPEPDGGRLTRRVGVTAGVVAATAGVAVLLLVVGVRRVRQRTRD